jgi:hypothetical protein
MRRSSGEATDPAVGSGSAGARTEARTALGVGSELIRRWLRQSEEMETRRVRCMAPVWIASCMGAPRGPQTG